MKLDIAYKEMESTDAIRAHIEDRADKLEKYVAVDEHVRVVVEAKFKGQRHSAEIMWHSTQMKQDFFAKAEGHNLYAQIDEAFDKVLKQVHTIHDKHIHERRHREPLKKQNLD